MIIEDLIKQAVEFEKCNRIIDAGQLYNQALEIDPNNFDALHGAGVVYCRQGQLNEAERFISRAISLNPKSAYAHNNLGSVLLALNRIEKAIEHYNTALAIIPDFADAHNNLAAAFMRNGALEDAHREYLITLRIHPRHIEAHNNLGALLQRLGRRDEGIVHFRAALKINPDYPGALNNLGTALIEAGNLKAALELCRKAVLLKPDFAEAHNSIGNILLGLNQPEQAIRHFKKAISIRPNFAEAFNNLGTAFDIFGDFDQAISYLKRAIDIDATYAEPYSNLGAIWLRYGRLNEAREAFQKAAELSPTNIVYLLNLSELKHFDEDDPHIKLMEKMSSDPALAEEQQCKLNFVLFKAYSDFKNHDKAAQHLVRANSLKRQQIEYDERGSLEELVRIEEVFTSEFIRRYSNCGNTSSVPIFIVGMPRSGTTLIEQVLASHEKVFGAGELNHFSDCIEKLSGGDRDVHKSPEFVDTLSEDWIHRLGDEYVQAVALLDSNAEHITDKMPANFRFVGLIHLALPNARIIHACRDPIDTCLSCYSILFSEGQAFSYDLSELGRLYKGYSRLMDHWRAVIPQQVMIDVQYENLVGNFESEARRILAHCGLEWSPACLQFHKTDRPVRTASARQVRQPLYTSAMGRWRPYANMLKPLLNELGLPSS